LEISKFHGGGILIVMKFGGTSLGNANRITKVADIVKSHANKKPSVVVSAVRGITDKLIELVKEANKGKGDKIFEDIKKTHHDILAELNLDKSLVDKDIEELFKIFNEIKNNKKLDKEIMDLVQSFGEQMSSKIVSAQLNKIGIKSEAFNAWDIGFLTNSDFGNAEPLDATSQNLKNNLEKLDLIPIITGFMGKTESGEITTLGRGGSDYTAAIIGSALDAEEIQIWTDVDGIMSADPKIVSNAKTLEKVSFAEASELAYFGAKVLHPKTILPAVRNNIPVKVLNTFNPKSKGTIILNKAEKNGTVVKAITSKGNITLINVCSTRMLGAHGFLAKLFSVFEKHDKSVDVIATSEVSVSMSISDSSDLDKLLKDLEEFATVRTSKDKSIICAVGEGMKDVPGVLGKIFSVTGEDGINVQMVSQGSSGINITFIVDDKDREKAINILHKEFYN